jgi:hypothetical protein
MRHVSVDYRVLVWRPGWISLHVQNEQEIISKIQDQLYLDRLVGDFVKVELQEVLEVHPKLCLVCLEQRHEPCKAGYKDK